MAQRLMPKRHDGRLKKPSGGQIGNLNGLRTGTKLTRAFDLGRVPREHCGIKIRVGEFVDEMTAAYLANGGALGPHSKGLLQEAGRWELQALLTNCWLVTHFHDLSHEMRMNYLKAMCDSTSRRNKVLKELGLHSPGASVPQSMQEALARLENATDGNAATE